ncbi:hypothetical protein H7K24_16160 [Mycobacterium fragae]|uniref:DUF4345 domain-containing protein n=1 Tax=Mycobacterium fragae TaxID=1260918 RepID=A0A1X1UYY4_9MYCO|nr:hypothetical protein [Mycobacterium fragae]MCV7401674.1 hypothetical protein [Mycobacterium fragae]ORV61961.1 hypothetical protein AWC06_11310 [Mycobacterium fragae]
MTTTSVPTRSRFVMAVLLAFGVYSTLMGLFMLAAPDVFFETLGAFGPRNGHYIFDNASFELPLGLLLLAALRWPAWRVPALAFATLHWALHALSHIVDTGHADGRLVGLLEFVGLALGTILLAVALRNCITADNRGR